jgi:3-hydroxyisobutyrate dehydrogenase-like beta-hydroxyacid dehydrogenase
MTLGFIGLGSLGTPIAENLIDSGHELYIYNRTASKIIPLAAKGAVACNSISELAKACTLVFSIVSDDAALKSLVEGENGLLKNLSAGSIHVSLSTVLPATARELAEQHVQHGQQYLASPVFGRPEAAAARKLNFVVAGPAVLQSTVTPLLKDAGGAGIWDFGEDITAANTVKLCGNFLIAAAMEAIGESVALATASGVDASLMWNLFNQTLFNTPVYHNYSKTIIQKQFEPGAFTMQLGLKDMNLALQQAASVQQKLPLAGLLKEHMQQLVAAGKGQIDWSAVATAVQ